MMHPVREWSRVVRVALALAYRWPEHGSEKGYVCSRRYSFSFSKKTALQPTEKWERVLELYKKV